MLFDFDSLHTFSVYPFPTVPGLESEQKRYEKWGKGNKEKREGEPVCVKKHVGEGCKERVGTSAPEGKQPRDDECREKCEGREQVDRKCRNELPERVPFGKYIESEHADKP